MNEAELLELFKWLRVFVFFLVGYGLGILLRRILGGKRLTRSRRGWSVASPVTIIAYLARILISARIQV